LQIGLKNWLEIIEKHYGVKPIIYSSDKFNKLNLSTSEFKGYTLWIANYNWVKHPKTKQWSFWQFSKKGKIKGVSEYVDLDVFKGTKKDLERILIK
jgi:lysozyme